MMFHDVWVKAIENNKVKDGKQIHDCGGELIPIKDCGECFQCMRCADWCLKLHAPFVEKEEGNEEPASDSGKGTRRVSNQGDGSWLVWEKRERGMKFIGAAKSNHIKDVMDVLSNDIPNTLDIFENGWIRVCF